MTVDTDILLNYAADRIAAAVAARVLESRSSFAILHVVLVPDAATYIGGTVNQVQSMIRTGEIPAVREFDELFVAVEDLDGRLAKHGRKASPEPTPTVSRKDISRRKR